jgi:hypothetical protein
MAQFWNSPLFAFMVFVVIFAVGDMVSNLTKGIISTIVIGCLLYLFGFWTGLIPQTIGKTGLDAIQITHLYQVMTSFGIALMITNLGTMINLDDFIKEWKTVLVALFGLVGLVLVSFTLSTWCFGRWYALSAAAPLAGGIIAGIITNQAAVAAGHPEIGGFALLMVGFQFFIGMPISAWLLRKESNRLLKAGVLPPLPAEGVDTAKKINIRLIPPLPKKMQSSTIILARLAIVAYLCEPLARATHAPAAVLYLVMGVLFTEIGFLDKQSLTKSGAMGLLMLGTIAILPNGVKTITPTAFAQMVLPIFGTLFFAVIFIGLFAFLLGKLLGYNYAIAIPIGLTALVAYPGTQIISEEVVRGLDASETDKKRVLNYILPKMLVGGFTTVTIASVILAGIVAPMIFK